MPSLSLDALTFEQTLKTYRVPVPEFGDGMESFIAELTADERDARLEVSWLEHQKQRGNETQVGYRAWVVAACLCSGEDRKFICETPQQIAAAAMLLGSKDAKPVTRLFAKAQEVNALGTEAIEALEKN